MHPHSHLLIVPLKWQWLFLDENVLHCFTVCQYFSTLHLEIGYWFTLVLEKKKYQALALSLQCALHVQNYKPLNVT